MYIYIRTQNGMGISQLGSKIKRKEREREKKWNLVGYDGSVVSLGWQPSGRGMLVVHVPIEYD